MTRKLGKRKKIGDVYAIPLPNGQWAFGRIFRDATIAIYKHLGGSVEDLPNCEEYQFMVGVYDYVLKSGNWPKVDHRPFLNEDEEWPPPSCIVDAISGEYSVYYRGEIKPSTKADCEGLEVTAVWADNHIIDRIMEDDKWNRC